MVCKCDVEENVVCECYMWTLCHVRIIFAWFDFSGRQISNQLDVSINMFVCLFVQPTCCMQICLTSCCNWEMTNKILHSMMNATHYKKVYGEECMDKVLVKVRILDFY